MRECFFVKIGQEKEIINEVELNGFEELLLIYTEEDLLNLNKKYFENLKKSSKIKIKVGLDVKKQKNIKKGLFDEYLQLGTISETIFRGITTTYNHEFEDKKDFIHQRRSGLNHVILKDYQKKNIKVLVSYADLQDLNARKKSLVLGRIRQNIKLCKKFGVNYELVNLSFDKKTLRHRKDVEAMFRELSKTKTL